MSDPDSRPPTTRGPDSVDRRAWVERSADRFIPRRLQRYREQILYLGVGGWNTLFGYAVFVVLYALLGGVTSYAVIIVASYVVAIANAYLGYRYVVFRSHGRVLHELPRFSLVYVLTMIVNLIFFPVALRVLPVNGYMVQAVFVAGVVVASYLGHKHFSFRRRVVASPYESAAEVQGNGAKRETSPEDPVSGGE